jgi:hypothetical protein
MTSSTGYPPEGEDPGVARRDVEADARAAREIGIMSMREILEEVIGRLRRQDSENVVTAYTPDPDRPLTMAELGDADYRKRSDETVPQWEERVLADLRARIAARDTPTPEHVAPHLHQPAQHRDGKPPWCRSCGLTADFKQPLRRAMDLPPLQGPYMPGEIPREPVIPQGDREVRVVNIRAGRHHIHSGQFECGIAYATTIPQTNGTRSTGWAPCSKLLNHDGECGYADNTPF